MTVESPTLVHNVRGIVDWYDPSDKAGFIISDYGDLLITEYSFKTDSCSLDSGQLVTCDVCTTPDGLKAMGVMPVDASLLSADLVSSSEPVIRDRRMSNIYYGTTSFQVNHGGRRNSFSGYRPAPAFGSRRRSFHVSDSPQLEWSGRVVRVFNVASGSNDPSGGQERRIRVFHVANGPSVSSNPWIGRRRRVFNVSTRASSARAFLGRRRIYSVSPADGVAPLDSYSEDFSSGAGVLDRLRSMWGRRPSFFSLPTGSDSESDDDRPTNVFTIRGPSMAAVSGNCGESNSKSTPGFDTARFEDAVPDELVCTICRGVLNNPVLTSCDHLFCRCCIARWLAEQSVCPMDRHRLRIPMDVRSAPRFVRNMLGGLRLRCDFAERGCERVLPLGEVESHEKECPHRAED